MVNRIVLKTPEIFRPEIHAEVIFFNRGRFANLIGNGFARILVIWIHRVGAGVQDHQRVHFESQIYGGSSRAVARHIPHISVLVCLHLAEKIEICREIPFSQPIFCQLNGKTVLTAARPVIPGFPIGFNRIFLSQASFAEIATHGVMPS